MEAVLDRPLFPDVLAKPRPAGWDKLRAEAEAALERQGWPHAKQEGWRHTDLAAVRDTAFAPAAPRPVELGPQILPESRGSRLVFVNGHFDSHRSNTSSLPPGVRLLNLAAGSELAHDLGSLAGPGQDCFASLNAARFQDGALVIVPRGVRLEAPLHVMFISEADGTPAAATLPRLFVVVERDAAATLVEEYQGRGAYLTSAVAEVLVRRNASLDHVRVQRESPEAWHFAHLAARVEADGHYAFRTMTLGARLSRSVPRLVLAEPGADVVLEGLALLESGQVADTHSRIDHPVPACTARQVQKIIADGASRAVFNGMIYVHPGAQGTDAQQQCRALLLDERARVFTEPQLEILADDVKCAHGAAIGQLDPEALFYLQSRGLPLPLARNVLTYGFASDLLAGIPVPSLRRQLRQTVLARTSTGNLEAL